MMCHHINVVSVCVGYDYTHSSQEAEQSVLIMLARVRSGHQASVTYCTVHKDTNDDIYFHHMMKDWIVIDMG